MSEQEEVIYACDMNALTASEREEHGKNSGEVFAAVKEIQERANGYAFRLSEAAISLAKVAEFIRYERLCCPFFSFNMEVDGQSKTLWLSLSGAEGVKPFIVAELGGALSDEMARAAGFR